MRSSKSHRDRLGVTLAGMLGLTGLTLLVLSRPLPPFVLQRSHGEDAGEVRETARDAAPPVAEDEAPASTPPRAVARTPDRSRQPSPPSRPAPAPWPSPPAPDAAPAEIASGPTAPRRLAAILRGSGLPCLGAREASLSPVEREHCREKLGTLAWEASSLPAIDPEERAGYDALARAQAPRRAMVPLTARGAGGAFASDDRARAGRRPRVGCALRFGPNADRAPQGTTGVRAGPCFLQPPGSASSPDAKTD